MTHAIRNLSRMAALVLAAAAAGCVHHAPVLRGHIATVAGRRTAGLAPADARKAALLEAAKLTVGHGYRYFALAGADAAPPAAGQDFTIRLLHDAQPGRGRPGSRTGIWDAYTLLVSGTAPPARK